MHVCNLVLSTRLLESGELYGDSAEGPDWSELIHCCRELLSYCENGYRDNAHGREMNDEEPSNHIGVPECANCV